MQRRVVLSTVLLVTLLATFPGSRPAPAQQNPFVGSWRGITQVNGVPITFNLVMGPDLRYSEQLTMRGYMTMLSGPAQNVIAFQVEDWQPRTQPVYHPSGTTGGYYTQEPVARPPGGTFRFQFGSANSFTLQDVNLGGVITFNRLR
jgi:ABC-type proline/glycine betaine transport system substrate-binding protein